MFSKDSKNNYKEWDEDKFIWRKPELEKINKCRDKKDVIPVIYRQRDIEWGIRAHPDMNWKKSLYSMILPWHNEFISIWLYVLFALYFWVELILISARSKEYEFNNE